MYLSPPEAGSILLFVILPRVPLALLASPWAKFFRLLRRLIELSVPKYVWIKL